MLALPRTTKAPVGNWVSAGGACAAAPEPTIMPRATWAKIPLVTALAVEELPEPPLLLAVSGTACHDCVAADQMVRKIRFMLAWDFMVFYLFLYRYGLRTPGWR